MDIVDQKRRAAAKGSMWGARGVPTTRGYLVGVLIRESYYLGVCMGSLCFFGNPPPHLRLESQSNARGYCCRCAMYP